MRPTRQRLLAVLLAAVLVGSLVVASGPIALVAPFSGDAWALADEANPDSAGSQLSRAATGPTTVESPYGEATVRYDDRGVPHVEAENDRALAYAVGYVQARDRLFQLDLQRRLMRGELAEAFGPGQVESDRFHRQMDFAAAANASWEAIEDEETRAGVEAYADGVNRYMDDRPLPVEFQVGGYEPDRWTPQDTLLVGKLVSWGLTGSFADIEEATVRERVDGSGELYPDRLDHDTPIVRNGTAVTDSQASVARPAPEKADFGAIHDAVAPYEPERGIGSNSWVVSGNMTEDGTPVVANDPHLQLTVPPTWYEMHLQSPETSVRGVAFPGLPVVVIGATDEVAWGFTNVGADVLDTYTYEWVDEETYRYEGETRTVESRTETIAVSGGENRTVEVQKTVHGPLLEREGQRVAVAWLGLTGTREAEAVYDLNHADSVDDVREALRRFDLPTQNIVAADRDGETLFRITGQYPIRTVDNETVAGDRVFDGSAGHGEWAGFEPYGVSDFDGPGFAAFEEYPEVRNAPYVATANQRTTDDPPFYIARSTRYADGYRGERIYQRLDERAASGEPMNRSFHTDLQGDTYSKAAEAFLPHLTGAREEMTPEQRAAVDDLEAWDRRMDADSEAALVFRLWLDAYRNATWGPQFRANGLDESYFPADRTLETLPAESRWFDDPRTRETETRADIAARALNRTLERIDRAGYETYGDYNRLDLNHPFPLSFLDYEERAMDGSPDTVFNFRSDRSTQVGASFRMVVDGDGGVGSLPGGQSGNPLSPHYDDRLDTWAAGDTDPLPFEQRGPVVIRFEGEQ
jgi:penicillin amidase